VIAALCIALALAAPAGDPCLNVSARTTAVDCQGHDGDPDPEVLDLTRITKAQKLTSITIDGFGVASLEPLRQLPGLTTVRLASVGALDLGPLAALTKLSQLDLGGLAAGSLACVAGAHELAVLNINDGSLTGFDGLAGKHLRLVSLYHTTTAGVLPDTTIEELALSGTGITDLRVLGAVHGVTALTLSEPGLASLAGLERLGELRSLTISDTSKLVDVSAIAKLPKLQRLSLMRTPAVELRPVTTLSGLTYLVIEGAPLTDASWLARSPALEVVSLADTKVADASALAALTEVKSINLARTAVADVTMLATLPELMYLIVTGAPAASAATAKAVAKARPKKAVALTVTWQ